MNYRIPLVLSGLCVIAAACQNPASPPAPQPDPPAAPVWSSVCSGAYYTLALKSDGTLWAWGDNGSGQLGLGTTNNQSKPQLVPNATAGTTWTHVAAGAFHSLAIKSDGSLWAWGQSNDGQLGLGDKAQQTSPRLVPNATPGTAWKAVAAGFYHSVALKSDGTLWAWGNNYFGQLGLGSTDYQYSPRLVANTSPGAWAAVSVGGESTFVLKSDGTVWGCGRNDFYQLGLGNTAHQTTLVQVPNATAGTTWTAVFNGSGHASALKSDGSLWIWGKGNSGQLGLGSAVQQGDPAKVVNVTPDAGWKSASMGTSHTVVLKEDGSLWTCGDNAYSQLGLGAATQQPVLIRIPNAGGAAWKAASAGAYHTIALKGDGTLWSWGYNSHGQLGLGDHGSATNRNVPAQVLP